MLGYAASGWAASEVRLIFGTPDADSDGIPDIWALNADGTVRFFPGGRAALTGTGTQIVSGSGGGWKSKTAVG